MGESSAGQRRFPRIPCEGPLLVRTVGKAGDEVFSKTRVIGLGGCLFSHPQRLEAGTNLWISIALKGRIIEAGARVVYVNPREDGEFDTGIEFVELSKTDETALAKVLKEGLSSKS